MLNLVGGMFWFISVTVVDGVSISFKECLFVVFGDDHLWTFVFETSEAVWSNVTVL